MRTDWKKWLIVAAALVLFTPACGKKAPPYIPEKEGPGRVAALEARWEGLDVLLEGRVKGAPDEDGGGSRDAACRIDHVWYPRDKAPCEGCPLEFRPLAEVSRGTIRDDVFRCVVPGLRKDGIHYFRVRLLGPGGNPGPYSNRAGLLAE